MKRSLLFVLVIAVVAVAIPVLLTRFGPQTPIDAYQPHSNDGQTIFIEACSKCHGERGEGSPLGSRLAGRRIPQRQVEGRVRGGGGGMPKFPHIREEALENLSTHVNRL